ncbi:MAG: hypothetical protein ACO3EZ_16045, partial [Prochlorotrichaceae cyanobacterium]
LTGLEAMDAEEPEEFSLEGMEAESSVDLGLDADSESLEGSFDAAFSDTSEMEWEGEDSTVEESLEPEETDNFLTLEEGEAEATEAFALPDLESDPEALAEDGFDLSSPDDALDLEDSAAEPFAFDEVQDAESGLEMAIADAEPEEDSFALPDFEEPMGDLDALDIPEDFPDPLADLSFAPHAPSFEQEAEPEEPFSLGNEPELPEEELTEDDMELDPTSWSMASEESEMSDLDLDEETFASTEAEPEFDAVSHSFREEELVTEQDLSPFAMSPNQSSEPWGFETIEPAAESSDFSLEEPDTLAEPEAIEDDFDSSFAELGELEAEPGSEEDPFGANGFDLVSDDEAISDSEGLLEEDSFEMDEGESLSAVDDFSGLDDLDSPPSDRDLEESFGDDFSGEILDDLSSLTKPEEPQTFEEWEGIAQGMPLEETPADDLEAMNLETVEGLEELDPLDSLDDLDSGTWDEVETPDSSLDTNGLNDEWDDDADNFDDLDDMALSPEELEAADSLSLDKTEPLVGDAMGLADVDAMDSLFQNSDNDFDFEGTSEAAELDPFLDLDDPFDDVQDSEEDPFAELDTDDSPLFPPPPPRPHR